MENKHTIGDLYQMQSLPLDIKVRMTAQRVRGWVDEFGEDGVYVSFSGGKDSTVLQDIVRNVCGYNNIPSVFVDVPTQYIELREFVKTFDNVEILKPKMSFMDICEKYGFPLISKEVSRQVHDVRKHGENCFAYRLFDGSMKGSLYNKERWKFLIDAPFDISNKCCNFLKKNPLYQFDKQTGRKPITAQMADESKLRTSQWIKFGCNGFEMKSPISNPMSFWTEQDVLSYIRREKLPICSVYGDVIIDQEAMGELKGQSFLFETGDEPLKTTGCDRTGCMLCGYGCHIERSSNRFKELRETHPKMYNLLDVVKNNGVTFREAIEWTNEHGNLNIKL